MGFVIVMKILIIMMRVIFFDCLLCAMLCSKDFTCYYDIDIIICPILWKKMESRRD